FLVGDTRRIIREAAKKRCFICYKMGASITCSEEGCDRSFHLPCAPDGECVTQYFGAYSSFCWEHRPQQAAQLGPRHENTCCICLDAVEDRNSYNAMECPACQDARFHRHCIRRLALHAGICFRCPRCQNREWTACSGCLILAHLGLNTLPSFSGRPPSWQSHPAAGPFHQRHNRCDAGTCLCPGGREHAQEEGPWQLRLCSSCAAEGTHRQCSSLRKGAYSWEC
ncbi:PHF7 protein, partial [Atrichornis clamosus]|nr:PHF7 protein [Atrichornis clamosus]